MQEIRLYDHYRSFLLGAEQINEIDQVDPAMRKANDLLVNSFIFE